MCVVGECRRGKCSRVQLFPEGSRDVIIRLRLMRILESANVIMNGLTAG